MKIKFLFVVIFFSGRLFAQNEAVLLKKADSLMDARKKTEALDIYNKIIRQNPKNDKALKGRADIYYSREKIQEAEKDYMQVLQLNKNCASCNINLAVIKVSQNNIIAAHKFINEAFKLDSANIQAFVARGRIHAEEKKQDLALQDYNNAIRIKKEDPIAYYYRGRLYYSIERYEEGANDMSTVIRLDSTIASAWHLRGIYYANDEQWEKALYDFNKAAATDTLNSSYPAFIGNVYLHLNDPVKAYDQYNKAIRLDDKNFEAHYYKSVAAYRQEDMEGSCACLKTMKAKLPANTEDEETKAWQREMEEKIKNHCDTNFAGYYYQRGIAEYNKKQFERSAYWYTEGLKKYPGHSMMTDFRGNTHLAMGKYKEAYDDYTASLLLTGNLDRELRDGATDYADQTPAMQKDYITSMIVFTYSSRAETRINMDDVKGAKQDAETAFKMMPAEMPEKETVYITCGIVALADNDNGNALSYFNKAIQANPSYVPAYINRALVKMNLAYKTRMIGSYIGIRDKNINVRFDLPVMKKTIEKRDNLEAALADCNKAIQIDPKNGHAYHIRAVIKILLNEGDYCYDLLKAEQLGYPEATALLSEQKCR
ncbi:MAG: tetratricopeptide repeat protein [Chitinophagaceae bacterium]|nr:tetratricopeptide repeat protein [Chitinophagaceae bacterium]